ncbi:hypothetical protein A9Z42_0004940 [Trichoderma parareesei]|uniref:DRBM domain-containing protein n=1 Tax=Trichoderma parareesei TaxID=858221 RepID=A0A2H2ZN75_TRIPA|nr:hypothetical protein A9Z42_0004940 [Trichoderma parareesei]
MRRPPRPRISGLSPQSASATAARIQRATISDTSAITSRRSRTRSRGHSSRLLTQKHRLSSPSSSRFYSDLASLIESAAKESSSGIGISRAPKATAMSAQSLPIPWDRLKRWIADQESAQQQGLEPSMTKPQLAALSHIVSFVEGPEPNVSDRDYVSLLMQYTQVKRYPGPTFTDQGLEVPVEGNFVMRWRTTCHLEVAGQTRSFPCEGYGLTEGEQPPLFGAKKASKQYAAKYALEYLQSRSSVTVPLPSTSKSTFGGVTIHSAAPREAKNQSTSGSSVIYDPPASTVPSGNGGGVPLIPPLSSRVDVVAETEEPVAGAHHESVSRDKTEFYGGKLPSLLEQVASEAKRLNFGCPEYKIYEDPKNKALFAGHPVFANGGRMPPDIGHVAGTISRNVAKEQIATALLAYFKIESDRREAMQRDLVIGTFR